MLIKRMLICRKLNTSESDSENESDETDTDTDTDTDTSASPGIYYITFIHILL